MYALFVRNLIHSILIQECAQKERRYFLIYLAKAVANELFFFFFSLFWESSEGHIYIYTRPTVEVIPSATKKIPILNHTLGFNGDLLAIQNIFPPSCSFA